MGRSTRAGSSCPVLQSPNSRRLLVSAWGSVWSVANWEARGAFSLGGCHVTDLHLLSFGELKLGGPEPLLYMTSECLGDPILSPRVRRTQKVLESPSQVPKVRVKLLGTQRLILSSSAISSTTGHWDFGYFFLGSKNLLNIRHLDDFWVSSPSCTSVKLSVPKHLCVKKLSGPVYMGAATQCWGTRGVGFWWLCSGQVLVHKHINICIYQLYI